MTSTAELTSPDSANTALTHSGTQAGVLDRDYTLEDKYTRTDGRIYLSGVQALVRLPLMQRLRDQAAGLNTGGFISGYRGSPLGGFDLELWRAKKHLAAAGVKFQPGLNEDLGATMVWGTQQTNLFPGAKVDGVFGMWYGKGPGVDRCGDVFKHGNAAGTSKLGGVLALAADDHACRSLDAAARLRRRVHQRDDAGAQSGRRAGHPRHGPARLGDVALYRPLGRLQDHRRNGGIVGIGRSGSVRARRSSRRSDFEMPVGGLNIRWPDPPLDQEMRLHMYAVQGRAGVRARQPHRPRSCSTRRTRASASSPPARATSTCCRRWKYLGLDERACADIGIRVYKVGMTWPLEPVGMRDFARGLQDILVVEEKRAFIESQMKELFYNFEGINSDGRRPSIVGKYDESGEWILPSTNELTPAPHRARHRAAPAAVPSQRADRTALQFLAAKEAELALPRANFPRVPHYCSGCPHNTSTKVPEGSRALAGIGCHYMVTWMDRDTDTFTHMGGEGVTWSGQAAFTDTQHVFQNLGDGTYFHSGSLAIRQSVATGVNITYKILYNDAVAMTGGQPVDGTLSVPQIAHQVRSEGVQTIVVLSDDIEKWSDRSIFPSGVEFLDRRELDATQKRLREVKGTSVLIYDQTCATEKRRRRKRGKIADPAKRVFVNTLVCEGCGDCGVKTFCVSVLPKETEFGRKREIDQSNCNKDYSCVEGFCPSFVTVHGGAPRKGSKPTTVARARRRNSPTCRCRRSRPTCRNPGTS